MQGIQLEKSKPWTFLQRSDFTFPSPPVCGGEGRVRGRLQQSMSEQMTAEQIQALMDQAAMIVKLLAVWSPSSMSMSTMPTIALSQSARTQPK